MVARGGAAGTPGADGQAHRMASRCLYYFPAMLAALSVAMVLASPLRGLELGDEGVVALGGWRILAGQVPYRDFFEVVLPLPLLTLAGAYRLLGVTVAAGRAVAVLYSAALAALLLAYSRRLLTRPLFQAAAIAPLVSCGVAAWLLPSHHWLADVFALGALLAFDLAADRGRVAWAAAGGALLALCAMTLQDQGGVLLVSLALWCLLAAPRESRVRLTLAAAAGAGAVFAALAWWLLPRVSAATLLYDWALFPLSRYQRFANNVAGFARTARETAALWRTGIFWREPVAFGLWNAKVLLVAGEVVAAWIVFAVGLVRRRDLGWRFYLMASGACAFLLPTFRCLALVNLEWALPMAGLAAAWGLERWAGRGDGQRRAAGWMAAAVILVFAGAGLARLPGLLSERGPMVMTPAGAVGPLPRSEATDLQGIVDAVAIRLRPGEPLFSTGFMGMLNVLTGHPSPAPFDVFLPPDYTTPSQVSEAISALDRNRAEWIAQPAGFGGGEAWRSYLTRCFEPIYQNARYELWKRKEGRPMG